MRERHIMTLLFSAAMTFGNFITASFDLRGLTSATLSSIAAFLVFFLVIEVVNRVTNNGIDRGFKKCGTRADLWPE